MTLLALDLDGTCINIVEPAESNPLILAEGTVVSEPLPATIEARTYGTLNRVAMWVKIVIINPIELARIINAAYTEDDCSGVVFFTSGDWLPSIRIILADNLELSDDVRSQLKNCPFHNPTIDSKLITQFYQNNEITSSDTSTSIKPIQFDKYTIQTMNKAVRWRHLAKIIPEYASWNVILFDDRDDYTDSFTGENMHGIHANTSADEPIVAFYDTVIQFICSFTESKLADQQVKLTTPPPKMHLSNILQSEVGAKRVFIGETPPQAKKPLPSNTFFSFLTEEKLTDEDDAFQQLITDAQADDDQINGSAFS